MKKVEKEINFLSDKALSYDEINKDRFGHKGIAETVKDIVLTCPTPFTVGLFGKWGTGKSTITNFLQEKLKNEGVIVVNFDVWKYEKDSLRRTFLQSVVDAFKDQEILDKTYTLEKELYQTLTISSEGEEAKFSLKRLKKLAPYLIGSYIVTVFVFMLLKGTENATITLVESLIIPILLAILQDVKNVVVTDQRSTTYKSIESPEQFEAKFQDILKNVKGKKVAIVVDNLDRCSHKKATELLSTIKTFLDVPKNEAECIFVIPCDDDAIKEHLENIYGEKDARSGDTSFKKKSKAFDPDEFLRKFFNTYVRIPDFIDIELQDYTEELLKETGAKKLDNSEVAYVITSAFRDNPRQIKQFINTLLSHYLLAWEREACKNPLIMPKGTITDNIGFLTKLLVIRHKFPEAYKKIKEERLNSTEINKLIKDQELEKVYPELKEFLNSTSSIPTRMIKSIRPFIYLKQSEDELKIPYKADLELALIDNKQDIVNEEFKHILKSPELLREYERFIRSLMKENKYRQTLLLNIIKSSLTALEKSNLEFPRTYYYDEIARFLSTTLKDQLHLLKPSLIFSQIIDRCGKQLKLNISSQYTKILSSQSDKKETIEVDDKWVYEVFREFSNRPDLLEKNREEITKVLSETFVPTISEDDIKNKDNLNDKIQLLLDFEYVMTSSVIEKLISKFDGLLKSENQQPFSEEKENFLLRIEDIFNIYHDLITEVDEKVLVTFGNVITQGINAIGDWNQKKIFIPICLKLKDILLDPQKANINTLIKNFWNNTNPESIEYVLNRFKSDARQKIIDEYWAIFQEISVKQQDKFNVIWKFSPKVKQQNLFKAVINSNKYQWGLDKLKEVKYKTGFKKETVSILLNGVKGLPIQHKSDFYQAINDMKCGYDVKLRKSYVNQLKGLLNNAAPGSQEVGYNALSKANYLSETHRRDITRNTIDWLRNLSPINYQYQYAIKSVILNWKILQPTPRNYYIDLIFEKLLKSSSDINDIELSVEILQQIKPTYEYEDYKKYFDDILSRLETESNKEIKNGIKSGLLKIRPNKLNKQNRDFWKKLEEV